MDIQENTEPPRKEIMLPLPWEVSYNELRQIEPELLAEDHDYWNWMNEDILQLRHPGNILIDVGWLPEGNPAGCFKLVAIHNQDWSNPLKKKETRSLKELMSILQSLCEEINAEFSGATFSKMSQIDHLEFIRKADDPRKAAAKVAGLEQYDLILSLLSDNRALVRFAVVRKFMQMGNQKVGDALFNRFILPEPDIDVRRELIRAFGVVGHRQAIPTLIDLLSNPDAEQRIAAVKSLAQLKAVEALSQVQNAYAKERSHRVRPYLKDALQRLARIKQADKK
jgi:hypothetical protein